MFELLNRAAGTAEMTVFGTEPAIFLTRCAMKGIELLKAEPEDEYTLRICVPARQKGSLLTEAQSCGCTVLPVKYGGGALLARGLRRRLLPAVLMTAMLCLLLWSKAYIWQIELSGNSLVPAGRILAVLDDCGVGIGSCWLGFTSDSIRSRALEQLPELAWLTVNVRGSRAEVIVRERVPKPEMVSGGGPCSLVASRPGFITDVSALMGRETVKPGDAVMEGELLISGELVSIGGKRKNVRALGEVWAETYYELSALAPQTLKKSYTGREKTLWSLVVGKKRVNFYGNSSIYEQDCDKIYDEYRLEAGGLFSLPVKLVRQTLRYYEASPAATDKRAEQLRMEQTLLSYLPTERGAEIKSQNFSASESGGVRLCLRARCLENIARTAPIETAAAPEPKEGQIYD